MYLLVLGIKGIFIAQKASEKQNKSQYTGNMIATVFGVLACTSVTVGGRGTIGRCAGEEAEGSCVSLHLADLKLWLLCLVWSSQTASAAVARILKTSLRKES